MDPAKSIFEMDYSFDPLIPEDNFGFAPSSELDLFGLESFLTNDFGSSLNDDFLSTLYLDDPFPSAFDDQFGQSYQQQQLQQPPPQPSNNFITNSVSASNKNNFKISNSSRKINAKAINGMTTSILEHDIAKSGRPKLSISSPKVYVSKSKKEVRGTSILVKQKKMKKKCSSLLSKKNSLLPNVAVVSNQNHDDTKAKGLFHDFYWNDLSLRDHDYCSFQTHDDAQVTENEIADILGGFCTDDVMLNELPECLGGLLNFSDDYTSYTSEDILNGLNNVCNVMTDQFIAENVLDTKDLPDLNLTEEIINQVTQCGNAEPEIPIKKEEDAEEEIKAIEGLIKSETVETTIILNHSNNDYSHCISVESNVDNCDSSSVTTGCTDESFADEKQEILRLKDQKSKRHRSLSSSSAILNKRKRRFSTRSSINSSDSMSDSSSSLGSSSSRSSSPERAFDFVPKPFTASNYAINFEQLKKYKKDRHQFLKQPYSRQPYQNLLKKEKKCQVIDSVNKKIYTLDSKLESGSASRHLNQMSANLRKNKNNYLLYIENIPENCRKSDIYSWFGKFGNIQDVQIYTKDAKYFASVAYQNFHEIEKARKHGNDYPSHPKFLLTFGNDRRNNYPNNLDSFSEKLDFRIEDHSGDGLIDGGSSSCSSENGIGAVDFDTFLSKNFI